MTFSSMNYLKLALKIGAALVAGFVVYSTIDKSTQSKKSESLESMGIEVDDPSMAPPVVTPPLDNNKGSLFSNLAPKVESTTDTLRSIQTLFLGIGNLITSLVSITENFSRMFTAEPKVMPRACTIFV